jgi:hypothetical protein
MTRLVGRLDALHARYVDGVNAAVAADDLTRAESLATAYDVQGTQLVAEHEGLTHLLPLQRQGRPDSRLRARLRRLTQHRAA